MNLYRGETIAKMMRNGLFNEMKKVDRVAIAYKILIAARWISTNGLCYQDFSSGNFLYEYESAEKAKGIVSVIDCDNLATNAAINEGIVPLVKGTGFYSAPEIAFGNSPPSTETDKFALATLFFQIMTGSIDSPYHGRCMANTFSGFFPSSMSEAAELTIENGFSTNWLTFIFDHNGVDNPIWGPRDEKEMIQRNWNAIPTEIQALFCQAFQNPFNNVVNRRNGRPELDNWKKGI